MVAVVPFGPQADEVARRLSDGGFTVVLVADDGTAEAAGRLAADLPGRTAVFVGLEGLAEFVRELFDPAVSKKPPYM